MQYANATDLPTRKAAVLASVYLAGTDQAEMVIPTVIAKLLDPKEDLDVRIAAATALGPLATPADKQVIDALQTTLRNSDPRDLELVWSSALSLAQLNQPDVADTILLLLNRDELAKVKVYDRETDPTNPSFRTLSEQEIERILINTMIGANKLEVPAVQEQIRKLAESDRSARACLRQADPARRPAGSNAMKSSHSAIRDCFGFGHSNLIFCRFADLLRTNS